MIVVERDQVNGKKVLKKFPWDRWPRLFWEKRDDEGWNRSSQCLIVPTRGHDVIVALKTFDELGQPVRFEEKLLVIKRQEVLLGKAVVVTDGEIRRLRIWAEKE